MLFPTLTFAVFFAVVFGLNWGLAALAERYAGCERWFVSLRKLVLLAASLVFYGWWSWPFALMLLASSASGCSCSSSTRDSSSTGRSPRWG